MRSDVFDRGYYQRFYESPRTRVQGGRDVARLAAGVVGIVEWLGYAPKNAIDIGAGSGLWRDWFKKHRPKVRYRSTDVSAYACERYGHELRDIVSWRCRERFDLVVCQGVLPYLSAPDAERAIANIAAMSRGFLFLEAVTGRDLDSVCDKSFTDMTMRRRSAAWYRRHLNPHFRMLAFGLWVKRSLKHPFFELECQG